MEQVCSTCPRKDPHQRYPQKRHFRGSKPRSWDPSSASSITCLAVHNDLHLGLGLGECSLDCTRGFGREFGDFLHCVTHEMPEGPTDAHAHGKCVEHLIEVGHGC